MIKNNINNNNNNNNDNNDNNSNIKTVYSCLMLRIKQRSEIDNDKKATSSTQDCR